jgi:hypothetical protein
LTERARPTTERLVMGDEHEQPSHDEATEGEKKRLVDRVLPELVKRLVEGAVERAGERLADNSENLRNFVGDMKLPKEVLHHVYSQIDDTKNGLYRVVAKEIRDVLEQTKFADEITKVLTKLSFEIKTEIRFIPNNAKSERRTDDSKSEDEEDEETEGLPRPEISSQVSVRDRSKDSRRDRRKREGT